MNLTDDEIELQEAGGLAPPEAKRDGREGFGKDRRLFFISFCVSFPKFALFGLKMFVKFKFFSFHSLGLDSHRWLASYLAR